MRPIVHCHLINGPRGDPVVYAELMFERRALLFDIGDITVLAPRKLLRVSHVFVSHTHMDHFAGFDHLPRLLLGRRKAIALYGPSGFIDRVEHKLNAYTWNVVGSYAGNLVLEAYEVNDSGMVQHARFESLHAFERERMPEFRMQDDVLAFCGPLRVRCAVLDHGTPCLGFALEEPVHVDIWKTRLDRLGLDVGSWLRDLKHAILEGMPGATPIRALRRSGGRSTPTMLPLSALRGAVQTVPGQRFAYIVDVRNHEENIARIQRLAFDANILFIECPFLESDAAHAAQRNHLTAFQAGLLARRARVGRLVPCHFSPRYSDRAEALCEEAERAFHG